VVPGLFSYRDRGRAARHERKAPARKGRYRFHLVQGAVDLGFAELVVKGDRYDPEPPRRSV
jgi:hypothetical protein